MEGRDRQENSSVTFDYSPWQRTEKKSALARYSLLNKPSTSIQPLSRPQTAAKSILPASPTKSPYKSPSTITQFSTATENLFPDLRKECSKLCRHGPKVESPEILLPENKKPKEGKIALLKLLIRERRLALEGNKQRYMKLFGENMRLKEEITKSEELNYQDVNGLLTKYKKFQGASGVLHMTHNLSLSEVENELKGIEQDIQRKLKVFRKEVEDLDCKIAKEKIALKVLHNYKEKEYPDKLEQIKLLQYEIGVLESEFAGVTHGLKEVVDQVTSEYIADAAAAKNVMVSDISDTTMLTMDSSVRDLARQNAVIIQEIDLHREELNQHRVDINVLEQEISLLKDIEKTNQSRRRHTSKCIESCIPGAEYNLRIPHQRYLPI